MNDLNLFYLGLGLKKVENVAKTRFWDYNATIVYWCSNKYKKTNESDEEGVDRYA